VPAVLISESLDMALPPKTDDDTPSSARADSGAGDKKTRRPRTRARAAKPVEEKTAKPVKRARRGAVTKPEQGELLPAVENREERREPASPPREERESREEREPRRESPAPPPAPEREERPEPRNDDRPASRNDDADVPTSYSTSEADAGRADAAVPPARAEPTEDRGRPQGGQPQGQPQHGGGRGDWQQQGGGHHGQHGGQDRGFWKHGKRKRGRHGGGGGGHWQPGGGGREQHPPQMPPPSAQQTFGDLPNPARFGDLAALDALAKEVSSGAGEPLWLNEIYAKTLAELTSFARELELKFDGAPNKRQLLTEIFKLAAEQKRPLRDLGYIDQNDRGSFVVHEHVNYRWYPEDAYLPDSLVKRYGLKRGHRLEVTLQPPLDGERCPSVVRIDKVMGLDPEEISKITPFEELVPYYPLKRILLEDPDVVKDVSMRAVDILTPIGFGQRGLIVAPPRTGKTILLQNIANSITANSPDVKLILLLIDERPEEVTDFKRHTKGEVVSSTFDETPESHVHCAEMVIEIARRRIEQGEHVVILLDSITRLARAYNALTGNQGKTMSGGLESNALQKPKRFFGSARNIEGGGSLTIIASALIDTGSRMDEIIFEEFKGTGNSELHLDRGLVERRIFPAINIDRSGTRKEELLYHPEELQRIYALRRAMQGLGPIESMEMLITRLKKTKSNAEFLLSLAPK
jgi:transcription termination factor Rho